MNDRPGNLEDTIDAHLVALAPHEPCHEIGRAALLCRLDIGVAQQRSPTENRFMGTKIEVALIA